MRRQGDRKEYRVKVDIPLFNGNLPIEESLDLIYEVEHFQSDGDFVQQEGVVDGL